MEWGNGQINHSGIYEGSITTAFILEGRIFLDISVLLVTVHCKGASCKGAGGYVLCLYSDVVGYLAIVVDNSESLSL